MQYLGYNYTLKVFIVYLKFMFNWVFSKYLVTLHLSFFHLKMTLSVTISHISLFPQALVLESSSNHDTELQRNLEVVFPLLSPLSTVSAISIHPIKLVPQMQTCEWERIHTFGSYHTRDGTIPKGKENDHLYYLQSVLLENHWTALLYYLTSLGHYFLQYKRKSLN